jgi:5'-methylthioadenosine phosphorylase
MIEKIKKIAVIGGSGLQDYRNKAAIFLPRHGKNKPPHAIDHKKNLLYLKEMGVDSIISVCSVGSLHLNITLNMIVIPDDYISFDIQTFFDDEAVHIKPGIDEGLRQIILDAGKKNNLAIVEKGIYWQTKGPRFETPAEIRMISQFADIVGMTMASEATLAQEQGIRYAAICIVDNFGNGLSDKQGPEIYKENQEISNKKIKRLLDEILGNI